MTIKGIEAVRKFQRDWAGTRACLTADMQAGIDDGEEAFVSSSGARFVRVNMQTVSAKEFDLMRQVTLGKVQAYREWVSAGSPGWEDPE